MAHSCSHKINYKDKNPNSKYNKQKREKDIHLINNKILHVRNS